MEQEMTDRNYAEDLERSNERAGKTYGFDLKWDPNKPFDIFFQESDEGTILFVIFYTLACRWNMCLGCNLPSISSSKHIDFRALMAQVDHLFASDAVKARRNEVTKVILSNNGSMLDEETFSSTALIYLLAKCNCELPELRAVTLETRVEYVDLPELEFLARALKEGPHHPELELAVGFEAFDDDIRNQHFLKGMTLNRFEELVERVAPYDFRIKTYFMQKCVPGLSDEEAVTDIQRAIDYLGDLASKYKVRINMHLNPTYAARGTKLADALKNGEFAPPYLRDVARAAAHARGKGVSIFIGLNDEGLAVDGGSFIRDGDEAIVAKLEEFNRTQNHDLLDAITANSD